MARNTEPASNACCAAHRNAALPDGESSRPTTMWLRVIASSWSGSIRSCVSEYAAWLACPPPPPPAKCKSHTEHESEVIPVAIVLPLVDAHVRRQQRHDERDRADQPL